MNLAQIVRTEFQPPIPSLVIVPNSSMAYWKGELDYWLGDTAEVVFYTGPPGARQQIAASEFWLLPGALDGKVHHPKEQLAERVPKPDVVLISMESMIQVRSAHCALCSGVWQAVVMSPWHHACFALLHAPDSCVLTFIVNLGARVTQFVTC